MRDHLATILDDFRRFGRQTAVVRYQGNRRRVTSYAELARLAGRFAALLAQRKIGPGDRVLVWGENSAEWIAAFHGCMLRGALAVPLDAIGTAEFAARVAADVKPKLAVGDAVLLKHLSSSPGQLPVKVSTLCFEDWLGILPAEEAGPIDGLSAETPLEILFTSGTTGDPKGIVLTHGNVLASVGPIENGAQPYMRWERLVHPLRFLNTLPLSHVFGQTMGLWVPPIFAAELHFEERLVAPRLVETIRRERISVLAAVPRVLALLKTHLELTHPGLEERVAASDTEDWGGAALVALPQDSPCVRAQVLGADLGRRCAGRAAGAILERPGIRVGAGLRNDGDHRTDHAEPPLPRDQGHDWKTAGRTRGKARSGWRGAGAGRGHLRRNVVGRQAAPAQG